MTELTTALANGNIHQFEVDKAVCPPNLHVNVFYDCSSGLDNIDQNPSSTSAKDSFHGTSFHGTAISLFRNFEQADEGCGRHVYSGSFDTISHQLLQLPALYACVPPALLPSDSHLSVGLLLTHCQINVCCLQLVLNTNG